MHTFVYMYTLYILYTLYTCIRIRYIIDALIRYFFYNYTEYITSEIKCCKTINSLRVNNMYSSIYKCPQINIYIYIYIYIYIVWYFIRYIISMDYLYCI